MVRSMFAAVAGLRAHQTKMDVIGNNVANVNTYGYKKQRATFRDQFYATIQGASAAGNVYGGGNPSQIGYGSQIGGIDVNFGRGGVAPTDIGTDVMIDGNGFFMVGTYNANGYYTSSYGTNEDYPSPTGLDLTRVGIFNFDGNGNLVDAGKNYVYGFMKGGLNAADADSFGTVLEPLQTPMIYMNADGSVYVDSTTGKYVTVEYTMEAGATGERYDVDGEGKKQITGAPTGYGTGDVYAAPMKLNSVSIGSDGTISGILEVNGVNEVIVVGKIAVANVPNANALEATKNGYYKAKDNTGVVTAEIPGEGSTGQLESGKLEMANVDLAQEFTDMITTQRGFQANSRIITVTDEMLQELVNLKR